ncbi:MAG: PhzF family phenazine biosynthesis protein [Candidatus Zixiibacteriota bacterium]
MEIEIVQIDAFTGEPYKGNPAAVCLLKAPADEKWMKNVAREMNLSETAFLYPIKDGYHLRWLTPKAEVNLCGHGTLASAHFLYEDGHEPVNKPIAFKTKSGWVSASKNGDLITLDFPLQKPKKIKPPRGLLQALGAKPVYVGRYADSYFVQFAKAKTVRELKPDMMALEKLPLPKVCVTAPSDSDKFDFVTRRFSPKIGINEDPVNGNSHTALAPYWGEILNKTKLRSLACSERGGELFVETAGDRVKISGRAVTVMRARLLY